MPEGNGNGNGGAPEPAAASAFAIQIVLGPKGQFQLSWPEQNKPVALMMLRMAEEYIVRTMMGGASEQSRILRPWG